MKAIDKDTLKQTLEVYIKLREHSERMNDYTGSNSFFTAIETIQALLIEQGVINFEADCDGLIEEINAEYED